MVSLFDLSLNEALQRRNSEDGDVKDPKYAATMLRKGIYIYL